MKVAVTAMLLAAPFAGITAPATAYADCGDPGQDPCNAPVPTVDQVVAILTELTDPNIPAANKNDIVTPGFTGVGTEFAWVVAERERGRRPEPHTGTAALAAEQVGRFSD